MGLPVAVAEQGQIELVVPGQPRLAGVTVCVVRERNRKLHGIRFPKRLRSDQGEVVAGAAPGIRKVEAQGVAGDRRVIQDE